MKEFDRIKDMIYEELDEFGRHDSLNKEAICVIGELVDILKDMGTVEMFEENIYVDDNGWYHNGGDEYSQGYMPRRYPGYGNSYRGRGTAGNGGSYGRRQMRGGYSREESRDHLMMKLEDLMNEAGDEQDRQSIKRLIDQMNK